MAEGTQFIVSNTFTRIIQILYLIEEITVQKNKRRV